MGEEEKENGNHNAPEKTYGLILRGVNLFVFFYLAATVGWLAGFQFLEGLISFTGALLMFVASIIAIAMEELA